jgi:hypothetical protein
LIINCYFYLNRLEPRDGTAHVPWKKGVECRKWRCYYLATGGEFGEKRNEIRPTRLVRTTRPASPEHTARHMAQVYFRHLHNSFVQRLSS